jgi:hypothetical protein
MRLRGIGELKITKRRILWKVSRAKGRKGGGLRREK